MSVLVVGPSHKSAQVSVLAHYKCPTSVSVVPALPRNATGKVLERQLRSSLIPDPGLAGS